MKNLFSAFFICFLSNFCFSQEQITTNDPCYAVKQQDTVWQTSCESIRQPSFPGGDEALFGFLKKEITYPKIAKQNNAQGKVFITFVIDKNGQPIDVEIYKRVAASQEVTARLKNKKKKLAAYTAGINEINDEALRVVKKMPAWSPGMQDGKPVKVRYVLPINFKLT